MKKAMVLLALWSVWAGMSVNATQVQEKLQLAMAINDNSFQVGTDKATTTFPNAGLNTTPTLQAGTEKHVVNPNAPWTKPEYDITPVWPAASAYLPKPPPQYNHSGAVH